MMVDRVITDIRSRCRKLVGYNLGDIAVAPLEWYVYTGRIPTHLWWKLSYFHDNQKTAIAKHLVNWQVNCQTHDETVAAISKYLLRAKNHYPHIAD